MPKMPQNDAGTRIEPLVSEPSASGTSPPATAPPDPPEEPPVMQPRVMRIARWAVVRILAGEVIGIFAHVERTDENGAGGLQPFDQRGVARGRFAVAVDLASPRASASPSHRTGS